MFGPEMLPQLWVRKASDVSRRGVDAWSLGSGRERTKGGVGWRRGSGGGAQGVAQGMAETGTAPCRRRPPRSKLDCLPSTQGCLRRDGTSEAAPEAVG